MTLANPADSPIDLDEYAREVENESGGSLRIEFEDSWRAGDPDNEVGTIEDVRAGKVEMGGVAARTFDLIGVNSLQPLVAPFAIDSYALEREVLESPLATELLAGVEDAGVVPIALLPGELRKPLGITRPLLERPTTAVRRSESGLRGLAHKRSRPSAPSRSATDFSDDVSSFDGIETQPDSRGVHRRRACGTLAINVSLWPRILTIVMNRDAYEALSDDHRDALSAAGRSRARAVARGTPAAGGGGSRRSL